ncbi:MAG TPA: serine/threonine-protein kinase, partial [Polyangia bacterium]|nr:serine/threonine-protein kinase [Polyangia bacterium]
MAEIYLALSGELSGFRTLVVVKRILPHLASNSQFIDMFFDEARIVARLDHPNIARIIEVGHDGDEYFLAMEVVQGKPLSAVLRGASRQGRPLTQAQCGYLVAQAANGLGYAHDLTDADGNSLGVVHRDVSPQNILVSFEGVVKVIDFGVARALGRVTETIPGGLKGKIQYMSPEQVVGRPIDRRSDVFALGVVLWEALCGRRLFRRDSEMETLSAIVEDPIPAPSSITRVSPRLERIVMQALEKDPSKRFQNAADMALALERHAFASEGFSPGQIATAMKTLFPAEHTRWRRTMAAAIDREGAPETWSNAAGTFVVPQAIEHRTSGPTVLLRPGAAGDHTPVRLVDHGDLDDTSVIDPPTQGGMTPSTELHWLVAPPEPSEPSPAKEPSKETAALAREHRLETPPPVRKELDERRPALGKRSFVLAGT